MTTECEVLSLFTDDLINLYMEKFLEEYDYFKKNNYWSLNVIKQRIIFHKFFNTHFPEIPAICYPFVRQKFRSKAAYRKLRAQNDFSNEEEKEVFFQTILNDLRPSRRPVTVAEISYFSKVPEATIRALKIIQVAAPAVAPVPAPVVAPVPTPAVPIIPAPPIPAPSSSQPPVNYADILSAMQR